MASWDWIEKRWIPESTEYPLRLPSAFVLTTTGSELELAHLQLNASVYRKQVTGFFMREVLNTRYVL